MLHLKFSLRLFHTISLWNRKQVPHVYRLAQPFERPFINERDILKLMTPVSCFRERFKTLTEKALRKTKHCMIPSIVSPVRQKVPVRWRPFLSPSAGAAARLACTRAPRGRASLVAPRTPGSGAPSISLASGSIPAITTS